MPAEGIGKEMVDWKASQHRDEKYVDPLVPVLPRLLLLLCARWRLIGGV